MPGPVSEAAEAVAEPWHCGRDRSYVGIKQWPNECRMESHVIRNGCRLVTPDQSVFVFLSAFQEKQKGTGRRCTRNSSSVLFQLLEDTREIPVRVSVILYTV